jgi:HlyD family secretion protein
LFDHIRSKAAGQMEFPRLAAAARRYRTPALLIGALGVLALAFGPRLVLGPAVPVVEAVQRDFVQSVVASGHVETPHRVSIGAQIIGTVRRVPVAEGQVVSSGQVLIELENTELLAALAQAELAVQQAEARMRQLIELQAPVAEQSLRQAQVNLDNARAAQSRAEDLRRQGFIGQAAADDARKAVDLAESQLRSAQKQLETARPRGSDYAMASSALAGTRASAAAARSRLAYATIAAPLPGTLIDRSVEPGDVVQPGKVLMVLSPAGATQLVVQIDEKNLRLLAIGQAAQASADAYPEARFEAKLVYINPGIDAQRGSVEVKLEVPAVPEYLRQDMTVSVDIQVASRSAAVLIPTDAVHDIESSQPWVLTVESGRARRRGVRLGLHGGGFSEVVQGIAPGDVLVASVAEDVADGARLRPIRAAAAARAPLP